ncbi:MAG: glucokinase [Planctomycetota bacterium]
MKLVLAGDVGGTKTNLALYNWDLGRGAGLPASERLTPPKALAIERFSSQDAPGLVEIASAFCKKNSAKPDVACFGIAGPIVNNHVKAPNIPWEVDAAETQTKLNLQSVALINDLEAAAYGVCCLGPDQLVTLQKGDGQREANIGVIAAGTGLGEASLVTVSGRRIALPSEGGHADFAPADEEQLGLFKFISEGHEHVSYERILAGPGIVRCYDYLRRGAAPETANVSKRFAETNDRAAVVSALALEGADPVAIAALQLFARIYGAEAGNIALRTLCYGGVFVAGGIAPKILPFMTGGDFIKRFLAKGRMARLMPRFPVHVVLEQYTPLLGAAAFGATL